MLLRAATRRVDGMAPLQVCRALKPAHSAPMSSFRHLTTCQPAHLPTRALLLPCHIDSPTHPCVSPIDRVGHPT